jgi:hypothetical protein
MKPATVSLVSSSRLNGSRKVADPPLPAAVDGAQAGEEIANSEFAGRQVDLTDVAARFGESSVHADPHATRPR